MRLIERFAIRVANFADRCTLKRLLDASVTTRCTLGTHLILELIRRVRNDACPIAWVGSGFADAELSRDELSNAAYKAAVTYCITNTAAVVERMNVQGLEDTLVRTVECGLGRRLFVPGL